MEAWIFNPPSSSVLPQHPGQGPRSPNLVQGVWSSPGGTAVQDVLTERMNDWICTERESGGWGRPECGATYSPTVSTGNLEIGRFQHSPQGGAAVTTRALDLPPNLCSEILD